MNQPRPAFDHDNQHSDDYDLQAGDAGHQPENLGPGALPFITPSDPSASPLSTDQLAQGGYSGLERQRGAGRRLSDFSRKAEEGELNREQFLFLMAIEEFKRGNDKPFPAWSDVLEVVRLLGYRKTMASEITLRNAEDWREKHDVPSNVRPQGWERRFRIAAPATSGKQHNSHGSGPKKHAA